MEWSYRLSRRPLTKGSAHSASTKPYYPSIWQGFYGGVNLGYGWSGDAQGVVGGGQVGFNWQSQQFVYGIEADLSLSDIGVSDTLVGPGVVIKATGSIDWLATIRGRYGVFDANQTSYSTPLPVLAL